MKGVGRVSEVPAMFGTFLFSLCAFSFVFEQSNAEDCTQFKSASLVKRQGCQQRGASICIPDFRDTECGHGKSVITFVNPSVCPNLLLDCCIPCARNLILSQSLNPPECHTESCSYARLLPGQTYTDLGCTYTSGEWGPCDPDVLRRERVDILTGNQPKSCAKLNKLEWTCKNSPEAVQYPSVVEDQLNSLTQATNQSSNPIRVTSEKSKIYNGNNSHQNLDCKYEAKKQWSRCDPKSRTRLREKVLQPGSDPMCAEKKTEVKPCFTKSGKERCFYSPWSKWSECTSSTQFRNRELLFGSEDECILKLKARICIMSSEDVRHRHKTPKKSRKS